jgi:hypothetical protein
MTWGWATGRLGYREEGDLGPVYGLPWKHFGASYTDMHADFQVGPGRPAVPVCVLQWRWLHRCGFDCRTRAQRFSSPATATLCAAVRCRPGCDSLAWPIQCIKTIQSLSALHTCTAPAAFVLFSSGQSEAQLAGLMQPINKTIS